eukprot:193740_1
MFAKRTNARYLVDGWLHNIDKTLSIQIPSAINIVIFDFYFIILPEFKWSQKQYTYGTTIEVISDKTIKSTAQNDSAAVANYCISSEEYKYFEWEFTIDLFAASRQIFFGFRNHPDNAPKFDVNTHLAMDKNCCYMSLYMQKLSIQGSEHNSWFTVHPTNKQQDLPYQKGDKFKIVIDFETREASLFYNDVKAFSHWSSVSDKILPCASLYNGSQITITGWNAY